MGADGGSHAMSWDLQAEGRIEAVYIIPMDSIYEGGYVAPGGSHLTLYQVFPAFSILKLSH